MSTGEPDATEIGHVRFGGGTSEKDLITGTSLASYPTARTVLRGRRRSNAPSLPDCARNHYSRQQLLISEPRGY